MSMGPPPGADPTLWSWFQTVDRDRSGQISTDELRAALMNNNWSHFNLETCRLMIGMLFSFTVFRPHLVFNVRVIFSKLLIISCVM